MKFEILSEFDTLEACATLSIARFGDGELRLATGGEAISQKADPKLAAELRAILERYEGFAVGLPNIATTPNQDTWIRYFAPQFLKLYGQDCYASSFITRPDNAPWIDTPAYWEAVRGLWHGKNVALVVGDTKSLTPGMLASAKSVRVIQGPRRDAYSKVDELEDQCMESGYDLVLLCLGATATVLAARLARQGFHALDLGHIGMFMKHAGTYTAKETLISAEYERQNRLLHADPKGFGGDGKKHAERVFEFATQLQARSIVDYGCGEGTLKPALKKLGFDGHISEYDPAMPGKGLEKLKPGELVVCTDVLEHIEPDKLDAVLAHSFAVAGSAGFFTIATRPANKVLPDGRNAHLIQQTPDWWLAKMRGAGWQVVNEFRKMKDGNCREVWVWVKKPSVDIATAKS